MDTVKIIGIVLLVLCFLPFIIFNKIGKKKDKSGNTPVNPS
jgi:hypothetical protein